jgi:hypothetical protein
MKFVCKDLNPSLSSTKQTPRAFMLQSYLSLTSQARIQFFMIRNESVDVSRKTACQRKKSFRHQMSPMLTAKIKKETNENK